MSGAVSFPSGAYLLVERQLGRHLSIRFEIAVRCVHGWPAVIRNEPIDVRGEPHPNLYYLTCPWLRKRVARLEDSGFIMTLQNKISGDASLSDDLRRAQAAHATEYGDTVERGGSGYQPSKIYIAGAGDAGSIKCLHSHIAYFLVHRGYIVGQEISAALDGLWCPDDSERCAGWMKEIEAEKSGSCGGEER